MSDELKMEVPTLTLGTESEAETAEVGAAAVAPAPLKEINIEDKIELTPEEKKVVNDFVGKIDLTNSTHILQYGADAQQRMADFSDTALESVRTKDLGAVGDSLASLVTELKGFNALEEKKGGLRGLFHKAADPITQLKAKYDKAEANVEKVVDILEGHQVTLTRDIAVLDELFKANTTNFKQLSMYIVAGKKKLEEAYNVTLPAMQAKAQETGAAEDAQAANDFAQMCSRFEKKLYDLDLTRTVSLQMAPQIRLVQNNNTLMVEKIQTTLINTIPLWKSQMVLALGLANSEEAVKAQQAVSDTTNELLKKNAEVLKQTTIGVAKESERGIVDIETLKETNQKLIETIDEVMNIQKDGRAKRQAAEAELMKIETDLKSKLLEVRA
ncbi:MAG: toxic anion resistance protein [Firmicutes bacterium]|nr:toxic anion resistance protein [Bacillota bacterium]MDD7602968.1 toxic anion resistance protein [Bacillota bacterium]MDY5856087.1 toxic anion resistance protein [Anaerovoracaceae bacterium]